MDEHRRYKIKYNLRKRKPKLEKRSGEKREEIDFRRNTYCNTEFHGWKIRQSYLKNI